MQSSLYLCGAGQEAVRARDPTECGASLYAVQTVDCCAVHCLQASAGPAQWVR